MTPGDEFGIYVHIPFCPARCTYCDFAIALDQDTDLHRQYVKAVLREWDFEALPPGRPVSLYLGGGTPSLLDPELVQTLIGGILSRLRVAPENLEITLETNPGTVNRPRLEAYRASGVNRLSIGAQAWQDHHLQAIGRTHRRAEIVRTVKDARSAGFVNLSLDAIYGLPAQTAEEWRETLDALLQLGSEHLSLYQLQVEPGTPLERAIRRGQLATPDPDATADMADMAEDRLTQAGLERYEISNYARPGYASRHNQLYWAMSPYVAVGMGAHAYRPGRRWWNVRSLRQYLGRLTNGADPMAGEELLDRVEEMREYIWLGLRRRVGIQRPAFAERFGCDPVQAFASVWDRLRETGLVSVAPEALALTPRGRDLANQVAMSFIDAPLEGEE